MSHYHPCHFQLLLSWCIGQVITYLYTILEFSPTGAASDHDQSLVSQFRHPVSTPFFACRPIRLWVNDVPWRWWFVEVISLLLHQRICVALNPSLVCTVGRLLSLWSKPLEEVATPGKGALVILLIGSTPFSMRMAQLTLSVKSSGCFKATTICWRVLSGRLKICP